MVRISSLFARTCLAIGTATAITTPQCTPYSKCPESTPCCSAYGQCGVGAYCLGGCDPMSSNSLDSCMARPTCKSEDFLFTSTKGMQANTDYLGDATNTNWVVEGIPKPYEGTMLLTMPPDSVGTLLSSTHYVWYGKISATMRTSAGQGVVTAFIMMSDVKDEIDFEFVGADLNAAQSNFYWQGVTNYTNSANLTASSTNTDWHTYTIDWQEDQLTWAIDGRVMRTLKKADTKNATTGEYMYPQTPARVQLSLWPAGLAKNGKGTVDWAGGYINWNNSPYMPNGYYYAQVKEVTVECADTPSGANIQGSKSYQYTNLNGLQSSVAITNDNTVLGSLYATGQDQQYNPDKKHSGGSSKPVPSNAPQVPGGETGARGSQGAGSGVSNTPGNNPNGGSGFNEPSHQFTQGLQNKAMQNTIVQGSAIAAIVAFGALVLV